MPEIEGVVTAMVTPFTDGGELDEAAVRRLVRHLLENGSNGLVVAGTTGESPTLRDEEKLALVRWAREEGGPETLVICGTGSNDTRHSVELTAAAAKAGADAALVVTPYYNKPNRAGILAHFAAVAAAGLPIVVYNIPARCVVNISPELLAELAQIPGVVAVKQANNDEVGPIEGMTLLAGNDDCFLASLEAGGAGGILVASHLIGPELRELYEAARSGDWERARELDAELSDFCEALSVTTNPIPVKAALAMLGLCGSAMRLPMVPPDAEQQAVIRTALESRGLTVVAA